MAEQLETVLLVDADVIARTVLAEYLRHCGYRVVEATSYEEALAALRHEPFAINVVLAEVQLSGPGRSGFDLSRWVRAERPDVQVLLAGAVERAADAAAELCESGPDLAKPYHPQTIVDQIRRLKAGSLPKD